MKPWKLLVMWRLLSRECSVSPSLLSQHLTLLLLLSLNCSIAPPLCSCRGPGRPLVFSAFLCPSSSPILRPRLPSSPSFVVKFSSYLCQSVPACQLPSQPFWSWRTAAGRFVHQVVQRSSGRIIQVWIWRELLLYYTWPVFIYFNPSFVSVVITLHKFRQQRSRKQFLHSDFLFATLFQFLDCFSSSEEPPDG